MRRSLPRTFFRPERPTLTSRSLQFITRPFQKRFREVFGNARILIFYLSIKAWEEKSLPKSHLGWFFLVFSEGKGTKENISIFWFIWPLRWWAGTTHPDLKAWRSSIQKRIFLAQLSSVWSRNMEGRGPPLDPLLASASPPMFTCYLFTFTRNSSINPNYLS